MRGFRDYAVSDEAMQQARKLGVSADTLSVLAKFSAPCTHPRGNRRHNDYVMLIEIDTVVSFGCYTMSGQSEEDRRDIASARQRIAEMKADPTLKVAGEKLEWRLRQWLREDKP